jgi:hypothetical protein
MTPQLAKSRYPLTVAAAGRAVDRSRRNGKSA